MSHMSRHDLKTNEFEELVLKGLEWVKNNRQTAYYIFGDILLALILAIYSFTRFQAIAQRANEKLAFAQNMLYSEKADDGLKMLDEIIAQNKNNTVGITARMHEADHFFNIQNYEQVVKLLEPVRTFEKPKELMPLLLNLLGSAQENLLKFSDAISTYNTFISKFPDHYLAPRIYESLARAYELNSNPNEAKAILEKIVAQYPGSEWQKRAQEKLVADK